MTHFEPWEDALIIEKYQLIGPAKLAEELAGKSKQAVSHRARKLGATAKGAPDWTLREDNVIRRCHPDLEKAGRLLPERSRNAIHTRSWTLKLGPVKKWMGLPDDVLNKMSPFHNDAELAEILGRTERAVAHRRQGLKLFRPSKRKNSVVPVLNDVVMEAKARGVNLTKLTRALGSTNVHIGQSRKNMSISALARVVEVLGGELYAEWED